MDRVTLRFVHHAGPYNPQEVAGFAPDVAARLVKLGVAVPAHPRSASDEEKAALAAETIRIGVAVIPAGAGPASDAQRMALAHQVLDASPRPGLPQATAGPAFTQPERAAARPGVAGPVGEFDAALAEAAIVQPPPADAPPAGRGGRRRGRDES